MNLYLNQRLEMIEEILSNISYKPDWKLTIEIAGKHHILTVFMPTFNVYDASKKEVFYKHYLIPDHSNESEVVRLIFDAIADLENHEAKEQFQYKGKRVMIPHAQIDQLMKVADELEVYYKRHDKKQK